MSSSPGSPQLARPRIDDEGDAAAVGVASGQQRGPRRRAHRRVGVEIEQADSRCGQRVEVGRQRVLGAVAADVAVALVVAQNDHDVRALPGRRPAEESAVQSHCGQTAQERSSCRHPAIITPREGAGSFRFLRRRSLGKVEQCRRTGIVRRFTWPRSKGFQGRALERIPLQGGKFYEDWLQRQLFEHPEFCRFARSTLLSRLPYRYAGNCDRRRPH